MSIHTHQEFESVRQSYLAQRDRATQLQMGFDKLETEVASMRDELRRLRDGKIEDSLRITELTKQGIQYAKKTTYLDKCNARLVEYMKGAEATAEKATTKVAALQGRLEEARIAADRVSEKLVEQHTTEMRNTRLQSQAQLDAAGIFLRSENARLLTENDELRVSLAQEKKEHALKDSWYRNEKERNDDAVWMQGQQNELAHSYKGQLEGLSLQLKWTTEERNTRRRVMVTLTRHLREFLRCRICLAVKNGDLTTCQACGALACCTTCMATMRTMAHAQAMPCCQRPLIHAKTLELPGSTALTEYLNTTLLLAETTAWNEEFQVNDYCDE